MNKFISAGLPAVLAVCAAGPAYADDVYRCEQNGQVIYTDQPCAPGAQPRELPKLGSMSIDPGASAVAKQFDSEEAKDEARQQADNRASVAAYEAKKAQQKSINKGLIGGYVVTGMTQDQVRQVLNEPDRVDDQSPGKVRWIYGAGRRGTHTVTFQNGLVVSDKASQKKHEG